MDKKTNTPPKSATKAPSTLAEKVANYLKDGIIAGRLVPGQRLVEVDITSELGISRGPLREAFRKLTAEGFTVSIPNKGVLVRRLSHQEAGDLFDIRVALETLAARRAAENMADPQVKAQFEQSIACIWDDKARTPGESYLEENKIFHQAIADASGNPRLSELCRQMRLPLIMLQVSPALDPEILCLSIQEHRQVARHILAGEGEQAAQAVAAHLERGQGFVQKQPKALFRDE